jgi:hypothetical protein
VEFWLLIYPVALDDTAGEILVCILQHLLLFLERRGARFLPKRLLHESVLTNIY